MISSEEAEEIRAFYIECGSISDTANHFHHDREAIRRCLERDYTTNNGKAHRRRQHPIDSAIEQLLIENQENLKRFHKNRLTPKRIKALLEARSGRAPSLRTIERRYKVVMSRLAITTPERAALDLTTPPGCFQADFGMMTTSIGGIVKERPVLILSSAFSNACAASLCQSQKTASLFAALESCFNALGGVPPVIRFDNLAPAIRIVKGRRVMTEAFSRFAVHHAFKPEFCNPCKGNEKGNVENKVKYIRENFFLPVRVFPNLDALNEALNCFCIEDRARVHYRKRVAISELFNEDVAVLLPIKKPFEYREIENRKTDKRGFVMFQNNFYYAGPRSTCVPVVVVADEKTVEIYDENQIKLNEHPRCYDVNKVLQRPYELAKLAAYKLNCLNYLGSSVDDVDAVKDELKQLRPEDRVEHIVDLLTGSQNETECAAQSVNNDNFVPDLRKYDALVNGARNDSRKRNKPPVLPTKTRSGNS